MDPITISITTVDRSEVWMASVYHIPHAGDIVINGQTGNPYRVEYLSHQIDFKDPNSRLGRPIDTDLTIHVAPA